MVQRGSDSPLNSSHISLAFDVSQMLQHQAPPHATAIEVSQRQAHANTIAHAGLVHSMPHHHTLLSASRPHSPLGSNPQPPPPSSPSKLACARSPLRIHTGTELLTAVLNTSLARHPEYVSARRHTPHRTAGSAFTVV